MTIISICVIFLGFYFNITRNEWLVVLILITATMSLELFNTGIEHFLDLFHPETNEKVKIIKDLIAGGVAIISIGSAIIGGIIFIPKIISFFS